jgi:hypothetical protein
VGWSLAARRQSEENGGRPWRAVHARNARTISSSLQSRLDGGSSPAARRPAVHEPKARTTLVALGRSGEPVAHSRWVGGRPSGSPSRRMAAISSSRAYAPARPVARRQQGALPASEARADQLNGRASGPVLAAIRAWRAGRSPLRGAGRGAGLGRPGAQRGDDLRAAPGALPTPLQRAAQAALGIRDDRRAAAAAGAGAHVVADGGRVDAQRSAIARVGSPAAARRRVASMRSGSDSSKASGRAGSRAAWSAWVKLPKC